MSSRISALSTVSLAMPLGPRKPHHRLQRHRVASAAETANDSARGFADVRVVAIGLAAEDVGKVALDHRDAARAQGVEDAASRPVDSSGAENVMAVLGGM